MIITEDDEVGSGSEQGIFSLYQVDSVQLDLDWVSFLGVRGGSEGMEYL